MPFIVLQRKYKTAQERYKHAAQMHILDWTKKELRISLNDLSAKMHNLGIEPDGIWTPPRGFRTNPENRKHDIHLKALIEYAMQKAGHNRS